MGNARTALFNWLFARQKRGTMVLRIEDTDIERSEARFEALLIDDLKWLGLNWDEGPDVGGPYGPYRQSDRLEIYREHAERLLQEGNAYLCFCTEEELQQERESAMAEQRQAIYSGKCRALDPAEAKRRREAGEACAIRLKIPEHPIRFHDIVRGDVEFSNEVVSDPIILRSSGMPVYTSIANFREMGVLPEALANYLALLGWAPSGGTREIFSPEELVKEFSLERVTPSPAVFDMEKLYWLNRHYIKQVPPERINKLALPYYTRAMVEDLAQTAAIQLSERHQWIPPEPALTWLAKVTQLLRPYVDRLDQLPVRASAILHYDARATVANPENAEVLAWPHTDAVIASFTQKTLQNESAKSGQLTPECFKRLVNEVKAETGAKGKELFHPIRIMIIGSHSGPEFDKLIPIIEEGSQLNLPKHVLSVRERLEEFGKARAESA